MTIRTVDNLLIKNNYFKNLSEADRLLVYNTALKALEPIYWDNIEDLTPTTILNKAEWKNLSNISDINNTLDDDLIDFSDEERILLYNMVQERISLLRINQEDSYYLISNKEGTVFITNKKLINLTKSIFLIIPWLKYHYYSIVMNKKIKTLTVINILKSKSISLIKSIKDIVVILSANEKEIVLNKSIFSPVILIFSKVFLIVVNKSIILVSEKSFAKKKLLTLGKSIKTIIEYQESFTITKTITLNKSITGV